MQGKHHSEERLTKPEGLCAFSASQPNMSAPPATELTFPLQVRVLYAIPKNFNTANVTMVDERGYGMLYRYWSDAFYQTVSEPV